MSKVKLLSMLSIALCNINIDIYFYLFDLSMKIIVKCYFASSNLRHRDVLDIQLAHCCRTLDALIRIVLLKE